MALSVTVVFSPAPRQVEEVALSLEPGTTVGQALQLSGLPARFQEMLRDAPPVGVWGRKAKPGQMLRDGDRVEIYRPLTVDPKVARRLRFFKQGTRSAGLFAHKRPGGKAGY